jgi:hypothetical protein
VIILRYAIQTPAKAITSAAGAFSWVIGNTTDANVRAAVDGDIIGVYIKHFAPLSGSTWIKVCYVDIPGTTGTILSLTGEAAISGTTPIYYPVRDMAVNNAGLEIGSPTSTGICYPIWGNNILVSVGSIGSPTTFSGLEILVARWEHEQVGTRYQSI